MVTNNNKDTHGITIVLIFFIEKIIFVFLIIL